MKKLLILFVTVVLCFKGFSQENYSTVNKNRLTFLIVSGGVVYSSAMIVLYDLWYKDQLTPKFSFVNDFGEWNGLDKLGHATTTYWTGRLSYEALKWAGVKENHAVWFGGCAGLFFMLTVEVFDGFSENYGASVGDLIADFAGTGIFVGQQLAWKEQRFTIKFSYHPTDYAQYRPDLLGSTPWQSIIKDYNGQTYWLSGNIHSFLDDRSRFPRWLNVAAGYGAEGMTGGTENCTQCNGVPVPEFERTRKYFLTLDVDLARIRTQSKVLKGIFTVLGFIKIPMPTIEYNSRGKFVFHYLYF